MYDAHELPLTSLVSIRPIQGWHEFLEAGNRYLHTAKGAYSNRRRIFTAPILYNIIAMAVEKFVMAALMRHGTMPYNHTMVDLVEAMEETFPGAIADIREGLLHLDTYQDICDPWEFTIIEPAMDDIQAMLELAEKLQELVKNDLIQ
ncbi:MAG: hypothetical protein M8357_00940 [Desulfobulbaceae bacterium]|nr:hypothetical protein [Desulfobulbaceae bacterium]